LHVEMNFSGIDFQKVPYRKGGYHEIAKTLV
jgi:hypothetical protein